jgi:hypothetical protein
MKKLLILLFSLLISFNSNVVWSGEYETNPGFRDLRPGITNEEFASHCRGPICYGIDNIRFSTRPGIINGQVVIDKIILDMGPIAQGEGDESIFLKMKNNFDNKYILDYQYSERDRQLFNEGAKSYLLVVYSNGQVILRINKKQNKKTYRKDLWLYVEYQGVESGKQFLKNYQPNESTMDDF